MKIIIIKAVLILTAVVAINFMAPSAEAQVELYSQGACGKSGGGDVCANMNDNNVTPLIELIISVLLYIAGVVAIIFIIVGGLKFVTSAGDPGKAASGRNTVLYAVAGLVVAAIAFVIVQYAFQRISPGAGPGAPGGVT